MPSSRVIGRSAFASLVLSALTLVGCSSDPTPVDPLPRVPVSGSVTFEGAPLAEGMIQFDPVAGSQGTSASGAVTAGAFAIEKALGPVPGKYQVSISSRPPAGIAASETPGGTPKSKPETIPAKYNTSTTLEADIPAGGSSSLAYVLKKS